MFVSRSPRTASATSARESDQLVALALPKGRMQEGVRCLLKDAGIDLFVGDRAYRPRVSLPGFDAKVFKPRTVVEMLASGSRDVGFAGADWVAELNAPLVELLDTGLDPVQLVLAAPRELLGACGELPSDRALRVATEYTGLAARWITGADRCDRIIASSGATEVFPPEDADYVIDNSATGATLRANGLVTFGRIMHSTTRLYASPAALDDPQRRTLIEQLILLLRSVLEARMRVMIEINVPSDRLDRIVAILPCMREPTVSMLHRNMGYAVKAAVPRRDLPDLIPQIKSCGGSDIVVTVTAQIVE